METWMIVVMLVVVAVVVTILYAYYTKTLFFTAAHEDYHSDCGCNF